jgi:hypothetical protein
MSLHTTASTSSLQQGVYVAAADPSAVHAFGAWTSTSPTLASDYLPDDRGWAGMDGSGGNLNWMFGQGWSHTGYTLSLGVPIIPNDSSGNPVGTLAQGATGAYNSHYVSLAQTLVAAGESNAYLRLGWEFDGSWYAWNAQTPADEASYAAYFQQIVTSMRSVPGQHFRFVWSPDAAAFTTPGYNVALAYPGNAYVNVIGLDAYDQSWVYPLTPGNAWSQTYLPELTAAHRFAEYVNKPIALTEWGVVNGSNGLGDDPYYVNNLIAWMEDPGNNVVFESYFDFTGGSSNLTGGRFPRSLSAFTAGLDRGRVTDGTNGWLLAGGATGLAFGIGLLVICIRVRTKRRTVRAQEITENVLPQPSSLERTGEFLLT